MWILLVMLGLIGTSVVLEWILPLAVKERLGVVICWGMMFITMSFLTLSTVGLLWLLAARYLFA